MGKTGEPTRALFEGMLAGDRRAFGEFFERNASRVLIYIQYHMGPRLRRKLDPSDILQNLHLRVLENFPAFSRQAQERGIHRTLIRFAEDEITEAYRHFFKTAKRDARREIAAWYLQEDGPDAVDPLQLVPSRETSITQRVIRQEEYQRVLTRLRSLRPLEQFITVTRVIEGLPVQEIADLLGKSKGAIHMALARVRDKLRNADAGGGMI